MSLVIQIKTIIYCMLYGIFFKFSINLFNRYLFYGKKINKILYNISFFFTYTVLFFIFNYYINGGYFHLYFLIFFIIGYEVYTKLKEQFNLSI